MSEEEHVLVTGGAGFIGRWVVAELLDRDYRVVGLDNLSNGTRRNVAAFESDDRFTFREGDVRDADVIKGLLTDECSACIHLAAEIDVHESLDRPDDHFGTNVIGIQNVLEACRKTETRPGLVGTCMVYDVAESKTGIDECHGVKPASPCAGSKLAAENLAESYHHAYDLPVTLLRLFNTYGPYQEEGVVPIFVDRDERSETLTIYGEGSQTRDLLYVTDCARFIVEATFAEAAIGEVINAGTGVDVSVNELAEMIKIEGTQVEYVEHHHPQSEIAELRCDPSKAAELLDWEPDVSLERGIEEIREWFRSLG